MLRIPLTLLALLSLTGICSASVSFQFTFQDVVSGNGVGFDDPTLGATRRAALQQSADLLAGYLRTEAPRAVSIQVEHSMDMEGDILAGADVEYALNGGFEKNIPMQVIQNGLDPELPYHAYMIWNFAYSWTYSDSIGPGVYDFIRLGVHELLHVLGFAGYINADGSAELDGETTTYAYFDQFVTDADGNRLIDETLTYQGGDILQDGNGSDVYFGGPNAVAAYGGLVPLYSPADFEEGSSLSHLDTDVYGGSSYIMTHASDANSIVRELSSIELGILQDLGYTVIPEASTYALWLGGMCLVMACRRRQIA